MNGGTEMDVREKLIELLKKIKYVSVENAANILINNGVTVQEWIPVTERLPESGGWVLCACRANIIEVLKYDSTMDDWDSTMPERCYMKGFVTNWMPMPQPPKGE